MQFDDKEPSSKAIWALLVWLVVFSFFLFYSLVSFWPDLPPLTVKFVEPSEGRTGESIKISGSGYTNQMTVQFEDDKGPNGSVRSIAGTVEKT